MDRSLPENEIRSGTVSIRKPGWSLWSIPTSGKAHDGKGFLTPLVPVFLHRVTNLTRDNEAVGTATETFRKCSSMDLYQCLFHFLKISLDILPS